jgi:hypothetical protein
MTEEAVEYLAYNEHNDIIYRTTNTEDFDIFLSMNTTVERTETIPFNSDVDTQEPSADTANEPTTVENIG